jgi:ATP-dependent helicase/nuclease subunit A
VMAEEQLNGWDAKRVASLNKGFERELERRGVPPKDVKTSAELIVEALTNSLSDQRGRWVLGPKKEARNEYRVRLRTSNGLRTLVIDRFFVDPDDGRWIVDYKTSRHDGANVEGFLNRELERYDQQLMTYGRLVKESKQGLYFPLHRGWRVRAQL